MSFAWNKTTPATGSQAVFEFKELAKLQGWTVPRSSDGTTYNPAGDQISSGGAGANGMANLRAWFVLRGPAGLGAPEWCVQRGTTNQVWRAKYSMATGFSLGAPAATVTPSAADEVVLLGAGSDAVPTFGGLFAVDGTYRYNCAFDNAAPFGFWAGGFPVGGGVPNHGWVYDPLVDCPPLDGSTFATMLVQVNAFLGVGGMTADGSTVRSSTPALVPTAANWLQFPACVMASGAGPSDIFPNGAGPGAISGVDQVGPIMLARRVGLVSPAYKGFCSLMKWTGTVRTTGDTLFLTRARIVYKDVSLPWDGSVPLV
jgi:hypothetical protein